MEPKDIQNASMDDMVFENRNKSYGAYILRKIYNKNVTVSTIVASSLFAILRLLLRIGSERQLKKKRLTTQKLY